MIPKVLLPAVVFVLLSVPASHASLLAVSVGPDPTESKPLTINVSGEYDDSFQFLTVKVKRAGAGVACAPTSSGDNGVEVNMPGSRNVGSFSVAGSYTPDSSGPYLACAWVQDVYPRVLLAAGSALFNVREPALKATINARRPVNPRRPVVVTINYSAEVPRELHLIAGRASGCGESRTVASALTHDGFEQSWDIAGTGSVRALIPGTRGRSFICAFIQRDRNDAVAQFAARTSLGATSRKAGRHRREASRHRKHARHFGHKRRGKKPRRTHR